MKRFVKKGMCLGLAGMMMAERGVPSSSKVREFLVNSGKMNEKQTEMFEYADTVLNYSSTAPAARELFCLTL